LANAGCERFVGSMRRGCLNHVQMTGERPLHRLVRQCVHYFNRARPQRGTAQRISGRPLLSRSEATATEDYCTSRPQWTSPQLPARSVRLPAIEEDRTGFSAGTGGLRDHIPLVGAEFI
jgi:hypothetical protein